MSLNISLNIDENKIVVEMVSGTTSIIKPLSPQQARNMAHTLYSLANQIDKQGNSVDNMFNITYR